MLTIVSVGISCLAAGFYAGLRTGNVADYEMRYYRDGMVAAMGPTPVEGRARWGTSWYENGEVLAQFEFVETRPTGRSRIWELGGQLLSESLKADAEGLSVRRWFFPGGNLRGEGVERNGKSEGHFRHFDPTGALAGESDYVDGKLEGEQKEYYRNGVVHTVTTFRHGERVGDPQYFDEQGNRLTAEEWKRMEEEAARVGREKRKAASQPSSRAVR
ncbi:MAG: toxin-antitoxin system YwqK family antitoxin [Phycisphaerales bacterium]|nr:toxin-antitoxin system YwqK family antitoxin [Phycisphaerales bacterium]